MEKVIAVIVMIAIVVGLIGVVIIPMSDSTYQESTRERLQTRQEKLQQEKQARYERELNCDHEWLTVSRYDWFFEAYQIMSVCAKCEKEVK